MPSAVQQQIADYLRTQGQDPNAGNISRAIAAASINPGLIPGLSVGGTGEYSPGDPRTGGLQPGNMPSGYGNVPMYQEPAVAPRRSVSAPTYNRPPPPGASVPGPGSIGALSELITSNQPPGGSTTPPGDNRNEPQVQQASRGAQAASSRPPPTLQPAQPNPLVDRLGRTRQFAYQPVAPTAAEDALQGQRVAPLGSVAPNASSDPDQMMTAMDKAMMGAANQGTLPNEAVLAQQRSGIAPGGALPSENVIAQQRSGVAPGEVVDTLAPPNPRPGMTLTRGDAAPPSGMLPLQGEPQPGDQAGRTRQRESPAYNPDRGGGPNTMIQPPPPTPPIHMLNAQDPATLAALIAGLGVGGTGLSMMLGSGAPPSKSTTPTAQNRGARRAPTSSVADQIITGAPPTTMATGSQAPGLTNTEVVPRRAPQPAPTPQPTPTPQPQPQVQPQPAETKAAPQPQTKAPPTPKAPTPQAERTFNEPNLFDRALGRVSMPAPVAVDIPTPTKEAPTVERTAMTAGPRVGPVVPTGTRVPIPVGNLDDPNNVAIMQARQSMLQQLLRRMPAGGKIIPTTRGSGPMGASLAIGPYGGAADLATEAALYGRGMGRQIRQ